MRGGRVNNDRVRAYRRLLYVLRELGLISQEEFVCGVADTAQMNPLVSANKIFIDKFTD
jgi:hypothetical protein